MNFNDKTNRAYYINLSNTLIADQSEQVAIVGDEIDTMSEQVAVISDGVMIDAHNVTIEEQVESVGLTEEHVGHITDESVASLDAVQKVEFVEHVEESHGGVDELTDSQV